MSGKQEKRQRKQRDLNHLSAVDMRWLLDQDRVTFEVNPRLGVVVRPYHTGELALWGIPTPQKRALMPQVDAHPEDWAVILYLRPVGFKRGLVRREDARATYDDALATMRADVAPAPVQGRYQLPDTEPGQAWFEDDPERWQVFIGATVAWGVRPPPGAGCASVLHEPSDADATLPLCEAVAYNAGGVTWHMSDDDHESSNTRSDRMWQANSDEQARGIFTPVYDLWLCPRCAESLIYGMLQQEIVDSETAEHVAQFQSLISAGGANLLGTQMTTVVAYMGKPGAQGKHAPLVLNVTGALDKSALLGQLRDRVRSGDLHFASES